MNGTVDKSVEGSGTNGIHLKEELVDFSGKGLKLDTEADGLFLFYRCVLF